ncbi:MAG TPA: hypothetical protein VGR07_16825, partial [Thermoanaerobaculia bacterium]|nr:hypothetical protein [Thermoanaerobaculia bacterium]
VQDLFSQEKLSNLGLEEVEYEENEKEWRVTVGFSRPWDFTQDPLQNLLSTVPAKPRRDYKVVLVNSETGEVKAVKNRDTTSYASSRT